MELLSISSNGIHSGQLAINVACDNISNAMNPDYCRKSAIFSTVPGQSSSRGKLSGGAVINEVKRINNIFINKIERQELSHHSYVSQSSYLMDELDKITSSSSESINGSISKFFEGLLKIDPTQNEQVTRNEAYGQLRSWLECVKKFDCQLDEMKNSTNDSIKQLVKDINSSVSSIAALNENIECAYLNDHILPSDLLDHRERAISQLSTFIGLEINEDDKTGRMDVRLAKGYPLVSGSKAFYLQSVQAEHQPSILNIHYANTLGDSVSLSSHDLGNGSLKASVDFYQGGLSQVSEGLNDISCGYAKQLNNINSVGYDYHGGSGKDIFTNPDDIKSIAFNVADGGHLALSMRGIQDTPPGNEEHTSRKYNSSIYNNEFECDNLNLKNFLKLNSHALVGGQNDLFQWIDLTSDIGSKTRVLKHELQITEKNLERISYDRKNHQGVDVDTEYFNLSFFTKYYQANFRAMQAAQSTFDMLVKL